MHSNIYAVYFSPTGTTCSIVRETAQALARETESDLRIIDFTPAGQRHANVVCNADDVLVFGFPVYAGRVPEVLLDKIARFSGAETAAAIVGVYGNRDYDDALLEAADLLAEHGFKVVAAGAFIGEHSMTSRVATGRPDANDLTQAAQFGHQVAERLVNDTGPAPAIKGSRPYKERTASPDIRPLTSDGCTSCGICVERCPMGIIDADDPATIGSGCIRCSACVKSCPEHAKLFDSPMTNKVTAMLEANCTDRKEPELFL